MVTAVDVPGLTGTAQPLKGIKKVAARKMVLAWQAPVFHLSVDIDMQKTLALGKQTEGATVTDVILAATRSALKENPALNAHYADEVVTTFEDINLGLAVATEAGLMVPVIHGADSSSLTEISTKRKAIVEKARTGNLGMSDIDAGTFTISNLGMLGIDRFDAILNPPQIGILAIGTTKEVVVARDGGFAISQLATFTLTCDHRAVDGATGAGFLTALKKYLEQPTLVA